MHLIDSLALGGAEQVAVSLVNALDRSRYTPHLCATRAEGVLRDRIAPDVGYVPLARRHTLDVKAVLQLGRYLVQHRVRLLHAHSSSVLLALIVSRLQPHPRVLWHCHFGGQASPMLRLAWRTLIHGVDGVVSVSHPLLAWARAAGMRNERSWYLPNFPDDANNLNAAPELPGKPGNRVVCVANIRTEKNHLGLIEAMSIVGAEVADAHLLLVGAEFDMALAARVRAQVSRCGLDARVHWLGLRRDVPAVLRGCDVGVLASDFEGLPMALLEYGQAGIPVVATDVGQCRDVLNDGRAGRIVPRGRPTEMARELITLLRDAPLRARLAQALKARVADSFSVTSTMSLLDGIYATLLSGDGAVSPR
ncbi:MAG: glycosyltransferase [Planctomycetota bacterium]